MINSSKNDKIKLKRLRRGRSNVNFDATELDKTKTSENIRNQNMIYFTGGSHVVARGWVLGNGHRCRVLRVCVGDTRVLNLVLFHEKWIWSNNEEGMRTNGGTVKHIRVNHNRSKIFWELTSKIGHKIIAKIRVWCYSLNTYQSPERIIIHIPRYRGRRHGDHFHKWKWSP